MSDSRLLLGLRAGIKPALLFALLIGCVTMWPALHHHQIKIESPLMATQSAARAWIGARPQVHAKCVGGSDETAIEPMADHSGYYAKFTCKTTREYVDVAMCFIVPFAFVMLASLGIAFGRRKK